LGYVQKKEGHTFNRAKMHTLHLLEIRASKSELVMNLNVPCKLKNGMLDLLTLDKENMSQFEFPSHARNTPPWVNRIATTEKKENG
jgi:hypothetical protein